MMHGFKRKKILEMLKLVFIISLSVVRKFAIDVTKGLQELRDWNLLGHFPLNY